MERLMIWFNQIIKKHKRLKKWQRVVTVLAAVITFATTYALILPAITVEKEASEDVSGMYLEPAMDPVGGPDEMLDENALVPISSQIAAGRNGAVSFVYEDEEIRATAVFSTEEAIPEDAVLVVNYVIPESEMYADLGGRAAVLLAQEAVSEISTCAFYDFALLSEGADVTPTSGLANIRIEYRNNTADHTEDLLYAGKFGLRQTAEEPADDAEDGPVMISAEMREDASDRAEDEEETLPRDDEEPAPRDDEADSGAELLPYDALVAVNVDMTSVFELSDGIITSLSLKGMDLANEDSVVGLLAGTVDEEARDEVVTDDGSFVLTAEGADYTVRITCDKTSGVPEEASLCVAEIAPDSEEYKAYLKEARSAMGLSEEDILPQYAARFFDIKIMYGDVELAPETGVTVDIACVKPQAEDDTMEVSALHFADGASEPEVIDASVTAVRGDGTSTVEFTAESFSVYGIVYTVDFHYEANGRVYDFSIPGGGFVSLGHLIEVLGINGSVSEDAADTDNGSDEGSDICQGAIDLNSVEVSEATRQFLAGVANVEFSSPGLLWVGKAEADSTIGGLVEANGLESEYSARLTEEQIAEIKAQTVEAGDWALISLQPFDSGETLTVTMANGDRFTVKVTDAPVGNELNGKTLKIKAQDDADGAAGLVMTSTDPLIWDRRYLRANQDVVNNDQIWEFEYDSAYGGTYRLKSAAEGQYLGLDNDYGFIFTGQANATLFFVDNVNDRYEFRTYPTNNNTVPYYIHTLDDNNTPRFSMETTSQRFILEEAEVQIVEATTGDWLLYLDEDQDEIYIRVGETITLRPYDEWTWKDGDVNRKHWAFPGDTSAPQNWTINGNETNEYSPTPSQWTSSNGVFRFNRHVKYDSELYTRYWSVQGKALKTGDYVIENPVTHHQITVHVIPVDDPYHKLSAYTGQVPVQVNLFDYDKDFLLDPSDNSNVEGGDGFKAEAINIDENGNVRPLHFLSSGNGVSTINNYTRDNANTGIVASMLVDGFPVLASDPTKSLDYLFDTSKTEWSGGNNNDAIIAYPNVSGLFQQDQEGYYYFNSNVNYAYYDEESNSMLLYEHTYTQNRTGGLFNSKPIGFFPFHDYESTENLSVNQNHELNHHLGMSMEVYFEMPKSGKVGDKHITYEFSGDDDVWVFIDDELVLDIGGIHQPLRGLIDFTDGRVYVYNASGTVVTTKSFDVGPHKLDMFYLERGGCDSNLALKMNMPLILGPGDVELIKMDTEHSQGLPDAVFGIWENPDCTGEPYAVAVSDEDGVVFKTLPVRDEGQVFYIREILAPEGYALDDTIYKATAGQQDPTTKSYPFTVTVLTENGETAPETYEGRPVVTDGPLGPIDLSVQKQWQNAAGSEIAAPSDASVKFVLKRIMTYVNAPVYTVKMTNESGNSFDTISAHEGDVLTISYVHNRDGSNQASCYTTTGYLAVIMPTNSTTSESRVTYTVNAAHASNGVIDIRVPDWFTNWCNPSNPQAEPGCKYPTFAGIRKAELPVETTDDTAFNNENHYIELPTNQGAWTDTFEDLPTQEVRNGTIYQYRYYVVEDTEARNVPDGFEAVYTDSTGTHPISGTQTMEIASSGTQKVINRELLDVPVTKYWPDYERDHGGKTYDWQAEVHMDYREVPVDGQGRPTDWTEYEPSNPAFTKILTKDAPSTSFEDLPIYVIHDDGRVYKREYSVVEKGYKVWENGTLIASLENGVYTPSDVKYALWYEHDAGENSTEMSSYYISVYNMHENRDIKRDITADIEKTWQNADGTVIQHVPDTYKAKFRLKRKVFVEYRNYEYEETPKSDWVSVTLVTDNDTEHNQTLLVPPGTPMYIRGILKDGAAYANVEFTRSDSSDRLIAEADDTFLEEGYDNLFKVEFTAPTTTGAAITVTMKPGSEDSVTNGTGGFILSDSSDRQFLGTDASFVDEFELSNADGWTRHFPESTGSGEAEKLPVIELSELDSEGRTANTYIYMYYFEEVSCEPDDFYAVFTDSTGNVLFGDEDHQFYSGTTIKASNRVKPGSIKITKDVTVDGEHLDSSDIHTALVNGTYTFTIRGIDGTQTANVTRTATVTVTNGQATTAEVDDLPPGRYTVTEVLPTNGTSLVGENGQSVIVETGVTGEDIPPTATASFTNDFEPTDVSFAKDWKEEDKTTQLTGNENVLVTYTLMQVAVNGSGEHVHNDVYEGIYFINGVRGTATAEIPCVFNVSQNSPVTVTDLPATGIIGGEPVTFSYYAIETEIDGYVADSPAAVSQGTYEITNSVIPETSRTTDVTVEKEWDGENADQIGGVKFKLIQEKAVLPDSGSDAFYPFIIQLQDRDGQVRQDDVVVFVKHNSTISIPVNSTGALNGSVWYGTTMRLTGESFRISSITSSRSIVLRLWSILGDHRWGDDWALGEITAVSGAVSEAPDTFVDELNSDDSTKLSYSATGVEYIVNMPEAGSSEVVGNAHTTTDYPDEWKSTVNGLPYYERGTDGHYYTYRYRVQEVSIIDSDTHEEIETVVQNAEGTGGESVHFTVEYDNSTEPLTVTNTRKQETEIVIKKVDIAYVNKENLTAEDLLDGATFKIEKYKSLDPEVKDTEWNRIYSAESQGTGGSFTFPGLTAGIYKIVETAYPTGYMTQTEPPIIMVDDDLTITLLDADGEPVENNQTEIVRLVDGTTTIVIGNRHGSILPTTGGFGASMYIRIGMMLFTLAGALLMMRRRRNA